MSKLAYVAPFQVSSNLMSEVQDHKKHLKKLQLRKSRCWRGNNSSMKCLGLMILLTDMTFFDNVTFLLAIRTLFLGTIGNNMPKFLAAKMLKVVERH